MVDGAHTDSSYRLPKFIVVMEEIGMFKFTSHSLALGHIADEWVDVHRERNFRWKPLFHGLENAVTNST